MGDLRVFLFGKLRVRCAGEPLPGLDARKVQELLCYLLLYRDRPHSREALAGLLWGDCPTPCAKKYLRQTLWQLQSALHARLESEAVELLRTEPEWIRVRTGADFWLDVDVFEQAFRPVQDVPCETLSLASVQAMKAAVDLYRGDLLEGWYQDWLLYERERLQNVYLAMLDKLMVYCEGLEQYEAGITYGARVLRLDHAHERTYRRLMRLYCRSGDRTSALRQYQHCVDALQQELGVKPTRRTRALYEQIRADRLVDAPRTTEGARAPEPESPSLSEALDRLQQFQAILEEMQHQVQIDMQVIERTSGGG